MMPRQFGPMSRTRWRRAFSSIARSSAAPRGPVSLKPPEMTMAVRVPARPQASTIAGTVGALVQITARSRRCGMLSTEGWHGWPKIVSCVGLTRNSLPGKCMSSMLRTSVAPIEPVRSEAPMMATDCGSKRGVR